MDGVGIERKSFRSKRHENLLEPKIRKPFGSKRYENLLDPKDTKTFWNQRYENLLDLKLRKPFGSKVTKTFRHENMAGNHRPSPSRHMPSVTPSTLDTLICSAEYFDIFITSLSTQELATLRWKNDDFASHHILCYHRALVFHCGAAVISSYCGVGLSTSHPAFSDIASICSGRDYHSNTSWCIGSLAQTSVYSRNERFRTAGDADLDPVNITTSTTTRIVVVDSTDCR